MAKLGDVCEQIRGVSYKPQDLHDELDSESIVLLRANNIQDGRINLDDVQFVDRKRIKDYQILKAGDILVCSSSGSKGLVGKAAYIERDLDAVFGAFCKVVRPKREYAEYIGCYFNSPTYRNTISALSAGANINNIRNEHIDNLEIPLYNDDKRRKIVAELEKVSTLISLRKQQLAKLDELVKARFVEMFGDPVVNPMGWPVYRIGEILQILESGWSGNGTQREKKDGEIAVLKVSAVTSGVFCPEECKVLDEQRNIKKYIFPQSGDILFSRANTRELVGATALISRDYPELILPDKLWKIRFCERVTPVFMKQVLSSESIRRQFSEASTGTSGSMFNVSMQKFKDVPVPLPPICIQRNYDIFVHQIENARDMTKRSFVRLEILKKALMQEYFGRTLSVK